MIISTSKCLFRYTSASRQSDTGGEVCGCTPSGLAINVWCCPQLREGLSFPGTIYVAQQRSAWSRLIYHIAHYNVHTQRRYRLKRKMVVTKLVSVMTMGIPSTPSCLKHIFLNLTGFQFELKQGFHLDFNKCVNKCFNKRHNMEKPAADHGRLLVLC